MFFLSVWNFVVWHILSEKAFNNHQIKNQPNKQTELLP